MPNPEPVEHPESGEDKIAEPVADRARAELFAGGFPAIAYAYPQLRFMGSKYRLLPWIHTILSGLEFDTAIDAFSGSGAVSYLLKAMGKRVVANDFLNLGATISRALIENPGRALADDELERLVAYDPRQKRFIERTFSGIFFTPKDLRFLDRVSWNLRELESAYGRAIALAALIRSCVKRQPRGVFTIAGDPDHYKDGRRDLQLSLREHFIEASRGIQRGGFRQRPAE